MSNKQKEKKEHNEHNGGYKSPYQSTRRTTTKPKYGLSYVSPYSQPNRQTTRRTTTKPKYGLSYVSPYSQPNRQTTRQTTTPKTKNSYLSPYSQSNRQTTINLNKPVWTTRNARLSPTGTEKFEIISYINRLADWYDLHFGQYKYDKNITEQARKAQFKRDIKEVKDNNLDYVTIYSPTNKTTITNDVRFFAREIKKQLKGLKTPYTPPK